MSQAQIRPRRANPPPPRQRLGASAMLITAVLSAVIGAVALPTFVVGMVGLLPSVVIFIVDDKPGRHLAQTVAALNIAGVLPVVAELWRRGHGIDVALSLVTDVFNLATMYGAAAAGWGLAWMFPLFTILARDALSKYRLQWLSGREKELKEEWDFDES